MARLGLLGPAIVLVGAAVAGVGAWYVVHARPEPGDVLDTIAAPEAGEGATLVVRGERGGDRSFLELHATSPSGDQVVWQGLIPHYAGARGRPALAWSRDVVTVRVERDGRAEVFAFSMRDAAKLGAFRLATEHEPITTPPTGPITLTDHVRAYEFVGGTDWHQLIGVDLTTGKGVWKVELGPAPVTNAGIEGGSVWVQQLDQRRRFDASTGRTS